jgi:SsrA-binding protein
VKTVGQNRRVRFDYQVLETIEAGLVLTGPEVKSCRLGQVDLRGAYVSFLGPQPVVKQATIAAYRFARPEQQVPKRDLVVLLHKTEIERLRSASEQKGQTVVPMEVRLGRTVKIVLALVQGRKKADRRQVIRDRDDARRLREGREI